jgi:tetratricopeptide (TPR) repeat protein
MVVLSILMFAAVAGCDESLKPATLALQRNDPAQALTLVEPLRSRCAEVSSFHEVLGLANELIGNKAVAEQSLRTAVRLDSKSPRLLTELGATLLRNGNPIAAAHVLDQAIGLDPANLVTLKYAIGAAVGSRNWRRSAELFHQLKSEDETRLLEQEPVLVLWLAQTLIETQQADRLDAALAAQRGSMPPGLLFSLGTLLAQHGMYAKAVDYFKQVPAEVADDALYFNLGLSYSHLRQFEDARRCYFAAIDKRADHADAYLHVGLDYASLGQGRMGLPWMFKAHSFDPDRTDINYALIEQLVTLEYFNSAKEVLVAASGKAPHDPLLLLAEGDLKRAQGDTSGAVLIYRKALQTQPASPPALIGLARCQTALGSDTEATISLNAALALEPHNPIANGELGLIEARHGNWAASLRHLEQAWAQNRSDPEIALELALAYRQTGRAADALPLLQSIAPQMEDSPPFHFQLAQIYASLRRPVEARRELDAFTSLKADSQNALRFDNPSTYVQ